VVAIPSNLDAGLRRRQACHKNSPVFGGMLSDSRHDATLTCIVPTPNGQLSNGGVVFALEQVIRRLRRRSARVSVLSVQLNDFLSDPVHFE
jgi:hypothetical protein